VHSNDVVIVPVTTIVSVVLKLISVTLPESTTVVILLKVMNKSPTVPRDQI
jgi:hypothetical protein